MACLGGTDALFCSCGCLWDEGGEEGGGMDQGGFGEECII